MIEQVRPVRAGVKPVSRMTGRRMDAGLIFKLGIAILWAVVVLFPLWWVFNVVFSPSGIPIALNPRLYPSSLSAGIEKIAMVLAETDFLRATVVTGLYAVVQIGGMLLLTSMAAYEFALFRFPGKDFLFLFALSSLMVPPAVTIIPLFRIVAGLRWINTFAGLAVPGMASAFTLFIFRQFMEKLPRELIDAASIDGAGHFGIWHRVIMPLCGNAVMAVTVWSFVTIWGNYLWPLVVISRPSMQTISLITAAVVGQRSWRTMDFAMATFFLASIPPILVYLFLQRYIVQSVSLSGLKG